MNNLIDLKLSSLEKLLGKALMERSDFKRRIEELEIKVKELEEDRDDLKHHVENQSLNMAHLENELSRSEQENEKRLAKLEIGQIEQKERPVLKKQVKLVEKNDDGKNGFGHFYGNDASRTRRYHDKSAVSRVLQAMQAGEREFNLKERDHSFI